MWTDAILYVVVHLFSVSCPVSFNLDGTFKETPGGRKSSIVKPLSAIIESPCSNIYKIPHSTVSFLSEILPSYKSEIKHIAPEGVIPTSAFAVV